MYLAVSYLSRFDWQRSNDRWPSSGCKPPRASPTMHPCSSPVGTFHMTQRSQVAAEAQRVAGREAAAEGVKVGDAHAMALAGHLSPFFARLANGIMHAICRVLRYVARPPTGELRARACVTR
mmetsp:Transcript_27390/g.69697  ORF Transcript_27390/g.69697 Transcript_27390/m.69697 type:complete len:122 (+) Transcript_27390:602-967(+)